MREDILGLLSNERVLYDVLEELYPEGFVFAAKHYQYDEDMNKVGRVKQKHFGDIDTVLGLNRANDLLADDTYKSLYCDCEDIEDEMNDLDADYNINDFDDMEDM